LWGEIIKASQLGPEDYDIYYKRSSNETKQKLKKEKEKLKRYFEEFARSELYDQIERDKKHHNLVRLCAKSFANTELSKESGYEFYFAEPLIEFGSLSEGNNSFDLLLFNQTEQRGIFIECKTSIPNRAQKVMIEVQRSIRLVEAQLDYLSNIIGVKLNKNKMEYVLCVYDKDSRSIIDTILSQSKKSEKTKYDPKLIKLWIYHPRTQVIQLYKDHLHENRNLTEMLISGFSDTGFRSKFELPYCIRTHPYRILKLAIIGDCYAKNLHDNSIIDPKNIKIDKIFNALEKNIFLGIDIEKRKELIKDTLTQVLRYGEKYQLLEYVNDEEIRLICIGKDLLIVSHNIQEKFCKNWVDQKSENQAKEDVIKKYYKDKGIKGIMRLSDYGEL